MIPKVIHYCWFGRNPLPDSALKCIESWKNYLPDYEIVQWNDEIALICSSEKNLRFSFTNLSFHECHVAA